MSRDLGPWYSSLHVEVLHSGGPQGVQDLLLVVLLGFSGAVLGQGPGLTLLVQSGVKGERVGESGFEDDAGIKEAVWR